MRLKVKWGKIPSRDYYGWLCRYGNVITSSRISPEKCFYAHIKKLNNLGVDISKFENTPEVITESEVRNG